ncbi:DHH family phosphoesterase [Polycladomyces subterraneus]|uniref:Cyclic-di-AMP phosphodiesterase n=1 Tax=Polycladomyces subterraneus TaxID=1016997 RepID=A0ABT8IIK2_9BACL|nr:DHH family phosphoesterase [Polycladomyces subterraneus]MDN4592573.1 DHH family phosphoesterase [Polycladomyces subterraneus]
MPKFITQRWHGLHMVMSMCFSLMLIALLSIYRWEYGVMGLTLFFFIALMLVRAERVFRQEFSQYVLTLSKRVKGATQEAIDHLPVGILLYDRERRIEWHNPFVRDMIQKEELIGTSLDELLPVLKLAEKKEGGPFTVEIGGRSFEVIHQRKERLYYFRDVTRLAKLQERYEQERVVIGLMHLDNFDEAGQGMNDQERTLLLTEVTGAISRWALKYDISLRRYDTDRFLLILEQRGLDRLMKSRFDILDEVREKTRHNKIPITLSIGLAVTGDTMIERTQNAQAALDIALARGGDQAAVHNGERIVFFGGKTNAVEKRTRVRARVISHALGNLIRDSERVLIMGHTEPDMDALGAAIGVLRAVRQNDRPGYIVLDEDDHNPGIERLLEAIEQHEYLRERIVTPERALQMVNDTTLVILVDTHKPSLAIEPRLLDKAERVVVIDHHRRGEEFVRDPVLVYLEPYASSTCELVTELLQYQKDRTVMDTLEATALFAGIVVDTKSFAFRSGSRTFEAASFLRQHGADLAMVQTLLKEDLDRFVKRAEIVKNTEVVYDKIAIATGEEGERYDQILIAQSADTLLNMHGIRAAFVVCERDDGKVSISARSQGDINVQVVMEEMGGGGHLTNAAVQLENVTISEARERLLKILEKVHEEGSDAE